MSRTALGRIDTTAISTGPTDLDPPGITIRVEDVYLYSARIGRRHAAGAAAILALGCDGSGEA
jgi:hypothetical protein